MCFHHKFQHLSKPQVSLLLFLRGHRAALSVPLYTSTPVFVTAASQDVVQNTFIVFWRDFKGNSISCWCIPGEKMQWAGIIFQYLYYCRPLLEPRTRFYRKSIKTPENHDIKIFQSYCLQSQLCPAGLATLIFKLLFQGAGQSCAHLSKFRGGS